MSDREPSFSRNFRIPKRAHNENTNVDEGRGYQGNYDNYTVERNWTQGATFTQYPTHYPPVQYPTPIINPVEPIRQNIWNTLNNIKERPKTNTRNYLKETIPDVDDASLPKELTAMFQPLYCKLCSAQLSSNVMAKIHYKSKNHEKNIRKFLIDYSARTGEPLHKRAIVSGAPKVEEDNNPRWFHCDVCDLPLTGRIHAESHYMGRNHRKAMTGAKTPAGMGYYDDSGKWVRTTSSTKRTLKEGEDTFGEDFKKKPRLDSESADDLSQPGSQISSPTSSTTGPSKYYCDLCKVGATCQEQLDMHFSGQKHKKKLKQRGLPMVNTSEDINKESSSDKPVLTDAYLATYRTPSGEYYCSLCNLTINSDIPFRAHLSGKSHRKKMQRNEQPQQQTQ